MAWSVATSRGSTRCTHYQKVILEPLQVSFSKNWDPNASADFSRRVDASDIQKIKDALASMFREEYIKELGKGGYTVTDVPGPDTIRVTPAIVDLYISAPDVMSPGRSRTYTTDAGQMTLDLEVRDSVTGQLMARAVDKQQAMNTGRLQWTNSVTNRADAQRAIDVWAGQLRAGLDRINGVGKNP
jgi:hypothetical protein